MTTDFDLDAVMEGGHTAPLDADMVPDENQTHFCRSCDEPLVGLYCADCGQKNDDYRRPLWRLGKEAIASLTAVENRIWRTWAALLFKPGKVAREYADGRREHWSSPVRVYIFTSILLFGFMELTSTMWFALEVGMPPKEGVTKAAEDLTPDDVSVSVASHWFPTQSHVDRWNETLDFDLLTERISGRSVSLLVEDAIGDGIAELDAESYADIVLATQPISEEQYRRFSREMERRREALPDGPSALQEEIETAVGRVDRSYAASSGENGADGPLDIQISPGNEIQIDEGEGARIFLDYIRNPAIGNGILNKWFPRIIFLMMPVTMFIGALFIRGRKRQRLFGKRNPDAQPALLYDHLVHAAYIHAVAYFVLFLGIVLARYTPLPGGTAGIMLFLYMLIYLPISLRRMFKRGWFKTVWTAYGVAFLHFFIVSGLVTYALVMGFADIYDLSG